MLHFNKLQPFFKQISPSPGPGSSARIVSGVSRQRRCSVKTLLILRHAKSDWGDGDVADHDRPLTERGKRDAPRVGEYLRKQKVCPTAIFSSTAKRARKTAEKVAQALNDEIPIHLAPTLYLAGPDAYLRILAENGADQSCLLVVGHNPGIEQLVTRLTREVVPMGTAALVEVQIDIDSWHELDDTTQGRMVRHWRPDENDS